MRKLYRRLLSCGLVAGAGAGGVVYYQVRYIPLVKHRSQPLPPRRQTPVFATGSEALMDPFHVPEGCSHFNYTWTVFWRIVALIVHGFPVLYYLLLSSIHGHRIDIELADTADKKKKTSDGKKGDKDKTKSKRIEDLEPVAVSHQHNENLQANQLSLLLPFDIVKDVENDQNEQAPEEKAQIIYSWELCPRSYAYDRLVDFMKEMGPTYIKLGQWMATRPDIFPDDLIDRLKNLFDCVPPHHSSYTKKELKRLGLEKHLSSVSKECLSSGSIAQVHTAYLKDDVLVAPPTLRPDEVDPTPASERLREVPFLVQTVENILSLVGWSPHQVKPQEDKTMLKTGTKVAVKIEHPNTNEIIHADMTAMKIGAKLLNMIPGVDCFALPEAAAEFSGFLLSQLDLRRESDNLLRFRYNFRDEVGVVFPLPIPQLSTPTVLIETFEEGTPCHDSQRSTQLADVGCRMFLKMLFEDNFVHADLHPGNLFIRYRQPDGTVTSKPQSGTTGEGTTRCSLSPTGWTGVCDRLRHWWLFFLDRGGSVWRTNLMPGHHEKPEVVVLDAGLVTSLSQRDRENFIALFSAVACGDGELGARLMMERSPDHHCDNPKAFEADMKRIFDTVGPGSMHGFSLGEVEMGGVLQDIFRVLRRHRVRVDGNFTTLVATVVVGEGLGRRMQPDYNIFGESIPYLVTCLTNHEMSYLLEALHRAYGPAAFLHRR